MLEGQGTKLGGLAPIASKLCAAFYSFLILGAIDASYGVSPRVTSSTPDKTDGIGSASLP